MIKKFLDAARKKRVEKWFKNNWTGYINPADFSSSGDLSGGKKYLLGAVCNRCGLIEKRYVDKFSFKNLVCKRCNDRSFSVKTENLEACK